MSLRAMQGCVRKLATSQGYPVHEKVSFEHFPCLSCAENLTPVLLIHQMLTATRMGNIIESFLSLMTNLLFFLSKTNVSPRQVLQNVSKTFHKPNETVWSD